MKRTIKLALIYTLTLSMFIGSVMAFTTTDAERIGAISKKMAEVTKDVAVAEMKIAQLVTERDQLNEKIDLVQNHINTQNDALNSYKLEIEKIVGGLDKTEK